IDRGQGAAAPLTDLREIEHSHFSQAIPALEQPPVHAKHRELRGVVEELRLRRLARNALAERGKESRGIHTDLHARIEVTNLTRAAGRAGIKSILTTYLLRRSPCSHSGLQRARVN